MKDAALTRLFVRFRDQRDGTALAAVFDATARELLGVAAHLVRDSADAEDLVQATFAIAIERASTFRAEESVKGWLYGILWREAAKLRRRAGRTPEPDKVHVPASADPAESVQATEIPDLVRASIAALPPHYREVLEPHLCGEKSSQEIASQLGRAPGTVRVQIQRGLELLRARLGKESLLGVLSVRIPTRGLDALRVGVLEHARVSPASATRFATRIALAQASVVCLAVRPWTWGVAAAVLATGVLLMQYGQPVTKSDAIAERPSAAPPSLPPEIAAPTAEGARVAIADGRAGSSGASPDALRPEVIGRVVDERGDPVAGARVVAGHEGASQQHSTSAADGSFEFARIPVGYCPFEVQDERFAKMYPESEQVPCGTREAPMLLRVHDPRKLEGVVVDEEGRPVPHAQVTLATEQLPGSKAPVQGHLDGVLARSDCDENGHFQFGRLRPGTVQLVIDHEGYSRTLASVEVADLAQRLVLRRGLSLTGRVLQDGRGLAGARVRVSQTYLAHLELFDETLVCDAEGRFTVAGLHSFWGEPSFLPTVFVSVEDESWQSARYVVNEGPAGELPELEVLAEPKTRSQTILTRVVGTRREDRSIPQDTPTGTAVLRVLIPAEIELPDGWREYSACVELDGVADRTANVHRVEWLDPSRACSFADLPAGKYVASILAREAPNFLPQDLELAEGQHSTVILSTGRASLRLVVRSEHGAPADLQFVLQAWGRVSSGQEVTALPRVDAGGALLFTGLSPGSYTLLGSAKGCVSLRTRVVVAGGDQDVVVTLPPGSIRGHVVGYRPSSRDGDHPVMLRSRSGSNSTERIRERVQADTDGRFECGMLPLGEYELYAADLEGTPCSESVLLDAASPSAEVTLTRRTGTSCIEGRITIPDPLLGDLNDLFALRIELVPLQDGEPCFSLRRTGELFARAGTYRFDSVPQGRYGILLAGRGSKTATSWYAPLQVGAAPRVEGPILEPTQGRPVSFQDGSRGKDWVSSWSLRLPSGILMPSEAFNRDTYSYELLSTQRLMLAPGPYELQMQTSSGQTRSQNFTVGEGTETLQVTVNS